MKLCNIHDLYEYAKAHNEGILGDLSAFDFMAIYNLDKPTASSVFNHIAFTRCPLKNLDEFDTIADVFDEWKNDVKMIMYYKGDNYKRLLEVNGATYDPKENYDRYETSTRTHDGVVSKMSGAVETGTSTNIDVVAHSVPNDSTTEKETGKTSTSGSASDNTSKHNYNNLTNETDTTEGFTSHIHGNVGVTESTTMLENYARYWGNYNYMKLVFEDIVAELCYNLWGID